MKNGNYTLVVAPENYPGKKYRDKYCYEHILVWWQNTGYLLKKGEIIHHKNGNHRDNRFENLELMRNSLHSFNHSSTGKTMIKIKCNFCKKEFKRELRYIKISKKKGQKNFYCNRSCMGSDQIFRHIKRLKKSSVD